MSSPGELWSPHTPPLPTPALPASHPPTHPLVKLDAHLRKNRLKRLKIKRGTTSKVNYILFNRLPNPVLLNKRGLVRAKAGNFNSKCLNRCFSNYYQVRTRLVFAETVTYYLISTKYSRHSRSDKRVKHNSCFNLKQSCAFTHDVKKSNMIMNMIKAKESTILAR